MLRIVGKTDRSYISHNLGSTDYRRFFIPRKPHIQ